MAGGRLAAVLDTIRLLVKAGIWVEIVTFLVPGFNDSPAELGEMAAFIHSVSPDIPWHITALHPDHLMRDRGPTPPDDLLAAAESGRKAGLRFVYTGNRPGLGFENTVCPACGADLVERNGYAVTRNRLAMGKAGSASCPDCGAAIPGIWAL